MVLEIFKMKDYDGDEVKLSKSIDSYILTISSFHDFETTSSVCLNIEQLKYFNEKISKIIKREG